MNWKNVKIYLIIILAAVNLFFAFSYISSMNNDTHLDDTAIKNTVEFINGKGVAIKADTIPEQSYQSAIVECIFDENYYETVAAKIRNCEKESINILPDDSIRIMMKDGSVFVFDSKFAINFSMESAAVPVDTVNTEISLSFKDTPLTDEQNALLYSFVYPSQADTPKYFSYILKSSYSDEQGYTYAECIQTVHGTEINKNSLTLKFVNNLIVSADGTWFFPGASEEYSYELYDQLSILIKDVQNSYTNISYELDNNNILYTIDSLSYIYCIYWGANQDKIYLIPAWKISTNQPSERIYNAVNCELYE